jgi:hypothetical protein
MNRSRWISLVFVAGFVLVTVGIPLWKDRSGQAGLRVFSDGDYAGFILMCMGLFCIWLGDSLWSHERDTSDDTQEQPPRATSDEPRVMNWVGWLFLALSVAIPAADLIR